MQNREKLYNYCSASSQGKTGKLSSPAGRPKGRPYNGRTGVGAFDFLDETQYNGKKRMVSKQIHGIYSEQVKGLRKIDLHVNTGQNSG